MNQKHLSAEYFKNKAAALAGNEVFLVFAAVFSCLVLRLFFLPLQSFSVDEAALLYIASFPAGEIRQAMHGCMEAHPPGYFLLAHFLSLFSHNGIWLRFSSVVFSCISVYALFKAVKEFSGSLGAAFMSAMLLAVSPFDCIEASEFRMYSLLELFFLLSMIYCLRLAACRFGDSGLLRNSLILLLIDSAGACVHFLFSFAVLAQIVVFLMEAFKRRSIRDFSVFCLPLLGFVLLFFAFFPFGGSQDMSIREKPDLWHLFMAFSFLSGGSGIVPGYLMGIADPWLDIRVFVGIAGFISSAYAAVRFFDRLYAPFIFLICFAAPVFLLSFLDAVRIFEFKYFICVLPFFIFIISVFLSGLRFKRAACGILISLFLASSVSFICLPCFRTADWKEAAAVISSRVSAGESVIVCPAMASLALRHYIGRDIAFVPVNSVSDAAVPEGNGFWICSMPFHPLCMRQDFPFCLENQFVKKEEWRMRAYSPSDEILIIKFAFPQPSVSSSP